MVTQCPKSMISAQSLQYLELFSSWRQLGGGCDLSMNAKTVEAIVLLEQEWLAEQNNEQ